MCELPLACTVKSVKARKDHRCCECRGVIRLGEMYHRYSGIWNDGPARFKVCNDCDDLRHDVDKDINDYYEKTPFEGLHESVYSSRDSEHIERFKAIKSKRQSHDRR